MSRKPIEPPRTPRCDEWARTTRAQMELLEEFRDWWVANATTYEDGGYPVPGSGDMQEFLRAHTGFDFEELERERRALLDYQRKLNERRS